jgi:hypothetical protein
MALYILRSILHLARLLYVRPEAFGPTLLCLCYLTTKLHFVICRKIIVSTVTVLRTSNFITDNILQYAVPSYAMRAHKGEAESELRTFFSTVLRRRKIVNFTRRPPNPRGKKQGIQEESSFVERGFDMDLSGRSALA